ncbi:MAG: LON peptidase substrate-binding domain-containing protein [Alphaproteobacteria bacterium]|nr:LON peptidase substrate-binding domain-containing protein [Alphaproteobacteria bacterium]
MDLNPFAPEFKNLPRILGIFPLAGGVLLPGGTLTLNIFEPRYRALVEDAMATHRLIGMIQPNGAPPTAYGPALYKIGCAGKITEFTETSDARYLITLTGICRFSIIREEGLVRGYRMATPDWVPYRNDTAQSSDLDLDRATLRNLLEKYFAREGMACDWSAVDSAPGTRLITCLSMACPLTPEEKQALLEAACAQTRARLFMTMLEMAVCGASECESRH